MSQIRKPRPGKETRTCVATVEDLADLRHAVMRWKARAQEAEAALADARRKALAEAADIVKANGLYALARTIDGLSNVREEPK